MSTCTICGGSGVQRVSSQRLRTCLVCLGQGSLSAAMKPAPLNRQPAATTAGLKDLSYLTKPIT
jgi:DnaJ-class molecular chaperone